MADAPPQVPRGKVHVLNCVQTVTWMSVMCMDKPITQEKITTAFRLVRCWYSLSVIWSYEGQKHSHNLRDQLCSAHPQLLCPLMGPSLVLAKYSFCESCNVLRILNISYPHVLYWAIEIHPAYSLCCELTVFTKHKRGLPISS